MTTASIIGSFVRPDQGDLSAGYWLHIEQVLPEDDTASLGEVAELVDEIWGTDPCNQAEEPAAETDPTEEAKPPVSEEEFAEIIRREFNPGLCGMNINGDYATQIKVAVSHPGERYTLRLTHGRIGKTVTVEEPLELTIVVKDAASVDLDFPVVSGGSFTWRGSVYGRAGNMTGPPITLSGRTLSWGQQLTGSIAVSGRTRYDLVDVTVLGDEEGEPGECRAICFFHGLIDEIDLQPPDVDNDDGLEIYRQPFCGHGTLVMGDPNDDEVTCYEDISYVYRCQCSGEEAYQHTEYQVVVPCPPGIRCQYGLDKCWSFMGHRTVLGGYVDCGETSGGLDDPEFRNKICCDQATGLPKCKTTYSKNPGGVPLDPEIEKEYRRIYKEKLRIVAVSPDDGDCGVTKTVIAVKPKNCCAEAEPIAWDYENSVEVLPDNTSGIVFVTGGVPPYHWSVRGQGFALNQQGTLRDGFTDTPYVRIYATHLACGWCDIEVTDGCTTSTGGIRSTNGQWALLAEYGGPNNGLSEALEQCHGVQIVTSTLYLGVAYDGGESMISGKYWLGSSLPSGIINPPEVGVKFPYAGQPTFGVAAGCLAGCTITDPIAGVFETILATGCFDSSGYTWSRTLEYSLRMYEWRC